MQGKSLTAGVRQVHADFQAAFGALQKVEYDVLQLEGSEWVEDHGRFRVALRELEKRLSQIIVLVNLRMDEVLPFHQHPRINFKI